MLSIELRQLFRTNGLIDDVVAYGNPGDYSQFSEKVKAATISPSPVVLETDSQIRIEISTRDESGELFTSLQNENDEYFSLDEWNARSILRVVSSVEVLKDLSNYLAELSRRGVGYSYISEFSDSYKYSGHSPEWRFHVQDA